MYPVIEQILIYHIKEAKHYSRHKEFSTVYYRGKKKKKSLPPGTNSLVKKENNKIHESGIECILTVVSAQEKTVKWSKEFI